MAIITKFRVTSEPSNEVHLFDDIVSAIFKANDLLESDEDSCKIERGTKFTRSEDFRWTTMNILYRENGYELGRDHND